MRHRRTRLTFLPTVWVITLACAAITAGGPPPAIERPAITGVAHIGLKTNNLEAARGFYGKGLGFQEPFTLDKPQGGLMLTYFKINDHQYIEVFPSLEHPDDDKLSHIAFETADAARLRDYLAAKQVTVPASLRPGLDGNLSFMVKDPDGHLVEFVQYLPASLHSRQTGKFMPSDRISDHILHVGVTVKDRAAADTFYKDVLGFREMWHGGMTEDKTNWIDMRVPEGKDWVEYMMAVENLTPKQRGVLHHVALAEKSVAEAYKTVSARHITAPKPPQIGRDGKWQLNLYDPNDTRVELMEYKPVRTPCCAPMTD